jgi:hypothetical protein
MTMKTFTAGWSLQKPDQNYFKKFLRLNNISIDGIVYPKRIPSDIEGIPVLDFGEAHDVVHSDDIVIDLSANPQLQKELETFFETKDVKLVSVAGFLDRVITEDQHDALRLPVAGIKASDIRNLKSAPAPGPFDEHFFDPESYEVASRLDGIFRNSEWQRLIEFDRDDTPGNMFFSVLFDLHARGLLKHLSVLDTPRVFLDAILKLKLCDSKASFTVSLNDKAIEELGGRFEFYRRSLADCIVPFDGDEATGDNKSILLAGSIDPIVSASSRSPLLSAICFMPRSIVDYIAVKNTMGERQYRILLRQPDTMAHNLMAAILTPALFGI